MEQFRKFSLALIPILLLSALIALPAVSNADPDRFDPATALYIVETKADVKDLPDMIDMTSTGKIIAILVKGPGLVIKDKEIIGPYASMTRDCIGIAVDEQVSVTVKNCQIDGFTLGIYYYASSGKILNNDLFDYGKNGITVNMPSSDGSVNIKGNTVTGRGPIGPGDWAQNGIQIGYGAKANVMDNIVSNHGYTGEDWAASGILVFEADDSMIKGNTITDNEVGIAIETWGWYLPSASKNRVVKNIITAPNMEGSVGVSILAASWVYSTSDAMADNNKVVNNVIEDQEEGVYVGIYDVEEEFDSSADNNKVIRNKFKNVDTAIINDGTATKIHANVVYL
jgi:parallel beta-helix repeat protein